MLHMRTISCPGEQRRSGVDSSASRVEGMLPFDKVVRMMIRATDMGSVAVTERIQRAMGEARRT
jgi:hypothetical protein